jgi:hypothetical protein
VISGFGREADEWWHFLAGAWDCNPLLQLYMSGSIEVMLFKDIFKTRRLLLLRNVDAPIFVNT